MRKKRIRQPLSKDTVHRSFTGGQWCFRLDGVEHGPFQFRWEARKALRELKAGQQKAEPKTPKTESDQGPMPEGAPVEVTRE